jgi:hypothetical protein
MFTYTRNSELIKSANPRSFSSPDMFFDNWYGDQKGTDIQKSFVFSGAPASAGDTSLASTAHGNYRNYLYGKQLWAQMNIRPTVFTAIPRNQYVKSGFRIIKDFATPAIVSNSVGEGMSHIPDVKVPSIVSLRIDPRVVVNDPYSMTLAQQALDGLDDTVNFDAILEVLQTEFSMRVNGQMLMANFNAGAYDPASADPDVQKLVNYGYFVKELAGLPDPVGMPICTLDNLVSGYTEYLTHTYANDAQGHGAVDLFNIDRHSAATVMDSYVDCAAAPRNVSVDLLDDAVQGVMPFWKDNTVENKVMVTGFDTVGRIQQLHYQFQRFIGYTNYQSTYNGIKTCPGDVVGFGVSQFKGIPIIPDYMCTKSQAGTGVSKIYGIDTNTIHHAILIPPTFIQDKTYLARRSLTDVATYYMASEMVCTKPRANFKIMDLQ